MASIPRATYRVQLNAQFTLRQATQIVPYLADLGISHVYCSPYLRARPGSTHGYDVVDHNSLNPEIGTRKDLEDFVAALRARDMGHILDFVPNHVGIGGMDNAWWLDVLEHGRASRYADCFDIDWAPPNEALNGKLLLPTLGEPYGTALEQGLLQLRYDAAQGSFAVYYHEHRFPLDPRSYALIFRELEPRLAELPQATRAEVSALGARFEALPSQEAATADEVAERGRLQLQGKQQLRALVEGDQGFAAVLAQAVAAVSEPQVAAATGFAALHNLLERQCYRLAFWRVAADDINYRRFFDVNDLAALRMENEAVFAATHALVMELIRSGLLDGLRIDHPDGLYDPAAYFARLQQAVGDDGLGQELPLYLLVEKITASFERLPSHWRVHGTTGYNFTNVINGLFVDARAKARMDRVYRGFVGEIDAWEDLAIDSKLLVMRTSLSAEVSVLIKQLARIAHSNRHTRDFTHSSLSRALMDVIACFPVYRTYISDAPSEEDRFYVDRAIRRARGRSAAVDASLYEFLRSMMLAATSGFEPAMHAQIRAFARKAQQVTAPVTAKGVEDTALYRFTRLASLNEVGGEPNLFGVTVSRFHKDAALRARNWPHEMLTTSTHDTKRSEDVRARINVLSEMPVRWHQLLVRWSRINRARRRLMDDGPAPAAHAEYLLYQTLVGTWPIQGAAGEERTGYSERIVAYMIKASREAKRRTSWANINEGYEEALRQFISACLEEREGNTFVAELAAFVRDIARYGCCNSLAQLLCKLTAPGVPDLYQGTELWDDSLVDPDNRRPVDYAHRVLLLAQLQQGAGWREEDAGAGDVIDRLESGRLKLELTHRVLHWRRQRAELYREGRYLPLRITGRHAGHLCAFARVQGAAVAVSVVPRLTVRLLAGRAGLPVGAGVWEDTQLELPKAMVGAELVNVLEGDAPCLLTADHKAIRVSEVLRRFPVGLLGSA